MARQQALKVNNGRLFRQFSNGSAHLRIGAGGGDEWLFRGMIDEVRIYKALPTRRGSSHTLLSGFTFPNRGNSTADADGGAAAEDAERVPRCGSACRSPAGMDSIERASARESRLEAAVTTAMVMQELAGAPPGVCSEARIL